MHKFKYVLLNILLTLGLLLSASSFVFAANCNPGVGGTCNAGDVITVTGNQTYQAIYTANPLVWSGKSYDFNYSGSNQTHVNL